MKRPAVVLGVGAVLVTSRASSGKGSHLRHVPLVALCICLFVGLLALGVATPPAHAATGDISGTAKDAGGAGLAGISVTAYWDFFGDDWWVSATSTSTAADGSYQLTGLDAGTYRVGFSDSSATYLSEYFNDKPTVDSADDVVVIGGATTANIDATLAAAGHITGMVKDGGGAGLGGIYVYVYRSYGSGGWTHVTTVSTAADGSYGVAGLTSGTYRVGFSDSSATYLPEYYNDKPDLASADDVVVIGGATTANIDATLAAAGHITGTVKDAGGAGLANIYVAIYRSDGSGGWDYVTYRTTAADGSYDIGGLPTPAPTASGSMTIPAPTCSSGTTTSRTWPRPTTSP